MKASLMKGISSAARLTVDREPSMVFMGQDGASLRHSRVHMRHQEGESQAVPAKY